MFLTCYNNPVPISVSLIYQEMFTLNGGLRGRQIPNWAPALKII